MASTNVPGRLGRWEVSSRVKDLPAPTVERLLAPELLSEAKAYWDRDLAGQVAVSTLPAWEIVVSELPALLARFLMAEG